jgi:hypothetical protein
MSGASFTSLALAVSLAAPPEYDPDAGMPPGGYLGPGEARDPEPPDGHDKLIASYILIPLGTLGAANGAALVWLSAPGHCVDRWANVGRELDEQQCRGLYIYSAIQVTYGTLMLGSGLVLLGIGLSQRKKWRRWKERGGVSGWFHPRGGGLQVRWRF